MELRENTKKAKRDARVREQEAKADRAGTSAFEQPSLGSFAMADTSGLVGVVAIARTASGAGLVSHLPHAQGGMFASTCWAASSALVQLRP